MVTVDTNWLVSHLNDDNIIILDTRGQIMYRFGHIKNSIPVSIDQFISIADNGSNLVLEQPAASKLFYKLGLHDKKIIIVYGEYQDPTAARIVWTSMYYGYSNVKLLNASYGSWVKSGLPIGKQEPLGTKIQHQSKTTNDDILNENIKVNQTIRADAQMIKEKQNDPNVIIIDARTPQEHFQARIPGSILNNWEDGLNNDKIKDKEELLHDFSSNGINIDKEIICYCHSGMRAAHKYIQFRNAGFEKVRVYDGSIIDWAQRHNPLR